MSSPSSNDSGYKQTEQIDKFEFQMSDDNESEDFEEIKHSILDKRKNSDLLRRSELLERNLRNSPLLKLPTEVLLQIFHYVEKKELFALLTVCRDISELIIELLWFRPNMQSDAPFKKIKEVMETPVSQTHWNYRLFIKRLNLSFMTKLVDDDLLSLFIGCPKLERLTLVNCTKLTRNPITKVLTNCDRLQSIDLTGVGDIHDDIIITLANNCQRLQGLYAPGCGNVSEALIIYLLRKCPMLKRVKFNNSENITDECILAMYENCKSLVEIDLHNCSSVTDKYLKRIFLELSQLREFRISNSSGITDKLLELLPDEFYLEKLRIIDITGCNAITDRLVEKLVMCAPRLRNVVLSKCMQITDGSLRALSQLGRSLHYIHLGHCGLITDFGVASLVRSCHRIQYIDLACCSQLTDWTLVELSSLQKLRRIGLVKCGLITDNGIIELVRRRGEKDCLERVHLSYCTKLTLGPIYLLLKSCPKLTHLSLTGISAFLRRDITQYCRDPPPDFNEYQRSLFCVFSGTGVGHLRNYLVRIMEDRSYILETNENTFNFTQPTMQTIRNIDVDNRQEDNLSLWARQRGLGILRNNEFGEGDIEEINREIMRELNQDEDNFNNRELRENLSRFLSSPQNQAFINRSMGARNLPATFGAQIAQRPVFPNQDSESEIQTRGTRTSGLTRSTGITTANQSAVPVINSDEDVEMEAADLFPRGTGNGNTNA